MTHPVHKVAKHALVQALHRRLERVAKRRPASSAVERSPARLAVQPLGEQSDEMVDLVVEIGSHARAPRSSGALGRRLAVRDLQPKRLGEELTDWPQQLPHACIALTPERKGMEGER